MVKRRVYYCLQMLILVPAVTAAAFDFSKVKEKAQALSQQPYAEQPAAIPKALLDLSYVQYQAIKFRPEKALWVNERLPFQIQFFLPGSTHQQTVRIHEVSETGIQPVPLAADSFSFGTNLAHRIELPTDLDHAGFRIIHSTSDFGEVGSFLGGTYFRMIGRGQAFGTSARGLALNTVLREKEEFPVFREFWLRKPKQSDAALTVWALSDSPSVAGAFEFLIKPGGTTITETKAAFFPRQEVRQFGVAPLTSMFLHDENSRAPWTDFRPEVHDADGLLVHTGENKVLWRPLESGKMLRVNAYQDQNPKGFGLMQRDRHFEQYQDLAARFELRPSVWVKPLNDWGAGRVELIQLPTNIEYTDNVVAFWVPAAPPKSGQSFEVAYQVHWTTNLLVGSNLGYVQATRVGKAIAADPKNPNLRFVIDFGGKAMEALTAREQLDAEVNYGEGVKFVADTVSKNPINGTWRLVLEFTTPSKAVDLQAVLKRRGEPITETWMYTWQP